MIAANNPYNLRYSFINRWKGLVGNHRGFCVFDDFNHSTRAVAFMIMRTYRMRHVRTYSQIIQRYAPASENDIDSYLSFILNKVGKFPWDEPKSIYDFARLLYCIIWFEQGLQPEKVLNEFDVISQIHFIIMKYNISPYGLKG